ncbi:MAG: Hpt domain-containing protein, partial [Planctomycetota bacterium]
MSDLSGFSLHELFRAEAEAHAATLSDGLVRLEESADASAVEPLMRAAHSIKGAARVVGLDIAVRLAHAMEDVLVDMQKGRQAIAPSRIDQLLKGADMLAALSKVEEPTVAAWSEANAAAVDALIESLRAAPPAGSAAAESPKLPAQDSVRDAAKAFVTASPAPAPPIPAETTPAREPAAEIAGQPASQAASATGALQAAKPAVSAAAAPSPNAPAAASRQSSVRLTADKLDRLLQLAGETMLESRRLSALRDGASGMKRGMVSIEDALDAALESMHAHGLPAERMAALRAAVASGMRGVQSHLLLVEDAIRRGEETSTSLYHEVLSSRMRPFSDATGALPRTVRDLARTLGKDARLEIAGDA